MTWTIDVPFMLLNQQLKAWRAETKDHSQEEIDDAEQFGTLWCPQPTTTMQSARDDAAVWTQRTKNSWRLATTHTHSDYH